MPEARPVGATYRLQLGPDLDFAAAAALVGYLADLGVTHLYCSPLCQARPGSTHGYDVADPTLVSRELGGEAGLRRLADAAHARGLGLVVDIVPNHLGTGPDTPLWEALLAEGRSGSAGTFFDVDWEAPLPGAAGKVVLPVLGEQYGVVLQAGELQVVEGRTGSSARADRGVRVRYFDKHFPLSAESQEAIERAGGVRAFAGTPGQPGTWTRLHALLERQHYRLVHWRAGSLVNYRRFFAIDELAGVRVEDDDVFDRTHALILRLVDEGVVDGLRVDHPDGLRDPAGYLRRLADRTGGVWTVVEKILHPGEALPDWPVAGTTGYEFANDVLGLFVDPGYSHQLADADRAMGGDERAYGLQVARAKREVLDGGLAADVRRLARRLHAVAQQHLEARDVDEPMCLAALTQVLLGMEVYRTYVDPHTGEAAEEDVHRVEHAAQRGGHLAASTTGWVAAPQLLVDLLVDVLLGRAGRSAAHLDLLARFQQLSGALTAKGVEDAVFYRCRRLLALNEVGGDPERFGVSPAQFHAANRQRQARFPLAMLTTSTHDTKRSEDVRLRMAALSEAGVLWSAEVQGWHERNADLVVQTTQGPAPDRQTEVLLYQTLIGVWPIDTATSLGEVTPQLVARVQAYARKACREAGERTSWTDPDEAFEGAVDAFTDAALERGGEFSASLGRVARQAAEVGMVSGLAQQLLVCTVPGVPDCYQGTELWDDSLVDPDNRRQVDFAAREALLASLDAGPADAGDLLLERADGRIKLWVLSRALRTRRAMPGCFAASGTYVPLLVTGHHADLVVAFARRGPDGAVVVVTPRLPGRLMAGKANPPVGDVWEDTAVEVPADLAGRAWTDALTGATHAPAVTLPLAAVLQTLPVALLTAS